MASVDLVGACRRRAAPVSNDFQVLLCAGERSQNQSVFRRIAQEFFLRFALRL